MFLVFELLQLIANQLLECSNQTSLALFVDFESVYSMCSNVIFLIEGKNFLITMIIDKQGICKLLSSPITYAKSRLRTILTYFWKTMTGMFCLQKCNTF